jgi:hypothetical protein
MLTLAMHLDAQPPNPARLSQKPHIRKGGVAIFNTLARLSELRENTPAAGFG